MYDVYINDENIFEIKIFLLVVLLNFINGLSYIECSN